MQRWWFKTPAGGRGASVAQQCAQNRFTSGVTVDSRILRKAQVQD